MKKYNLLAIASWSLYDFGITAFNVIVITFVFAAYFTSHMVSDPIRGTHLWGNTLAIAGLFVAVISPIAGSIADLGGYRKRWLFILTYIGIIATLILWFAYPEENAVWRTLFAFGVGAAAFEICAVFYNSLLSSIAPANYLGRISGWAWASGYLGGLISLFIVMVMFVNGNHNWFDQQSFVHIRISALFCAIWIMIFTLPLFLFVQDIPSFGLKAFAAIHQGFSELGKTIRSLHKSPTIFKYLIARMIYTDGLNTLFAFGGIYAVGTFHFTLMEVALFGVILNITSGLGAAIFSWLDDYLGSKRTILISLTALMVVLFIILLIHSVIWFWIIAPFVGLFIGPTQASSRTFLIRLVPPDRLSEMFGLYALSGRATAFIGPFLVGEITLIFNSQRVGMSIILAFLFAGWALLYFVNERLDHTSSKISYS